MTTKKTAAKKTAAKKTTKKAAKKKTTAKTKGGTTLAEVPATDDQEPTAAAKAADRREAEAKAKTNGKGKASTKPVDAEKARRKAQREADRKERESVPMKTFAIRIPVTESEAIHRKAGSGKASRFARSLLYAAATGDLDKCIAIAKAEPGNPEA